MKISREWRNRILWIAFLACVALVFALTAVHQSDVSGKESESSADQKHKVAFITKSTVSGFWKSVYAGAVNAATACNLELTFEGPENESDTNSQINIIDSVISENPDALILGIIDQQSGQAQMEEASDSQIPVIIADSGILRQIISVRPSATAERLRLLHISTTPRAA